MNKNTCRSIVRIGCGFFIGSLIFILFSCSLQPFTEGLLHKVKDKEPPVIIITSPVPGYCYQANVLVSGTVADSADGGTEGQVVSLSYEVLSTQIKDEAYYDDSGKFSFYFNTDNIAMIRIKF